MQTNGITPDEIRGFVRPDHVHRRAYADPEVFELEMERIFGRLWIYVAHESQLKKHGDFVRTRLGRHEVLVTRHSDGQIHVLHNRCPHRGARICMVDKGTSRTVQLPLSCLGVPHRRNALHGAASPELSGNIRLQRPAEPHGAGRATCRCYRGFVFADAKSRTRRPCCEHLGRMTDVIDNLVDRAPDGEVEIADSSFSLEYRGNWKLHPENAADIFHPSFVHSSSVRPAARAPANASILDQDQTREMLLANGFGVDEWEGIQLAGLAGRPHLHDELLQAGRPGEQRRRSGLGALHQGADRASRRGEGRSKSSACGASTTSSTRT